MAKMKRYSSDNLPRSVAEHCEMLSDVEITDEMIQVSAHHDILEMDFTEVELRVLAHMREDAEKMDDTDEFRRPNDLEGYDTAKVRKLLTLKDAEAILNGKGCQNVQTHESYAAEMFGIDEADVTPEQRTFVKNYRYMEMYGGRETFAEYLEKRGLPKPIETD
jgi:uncharacterized protein YecA (UPF0149 family)